MKEGGFEARKWCSNSEDVLLGIPLERLESNSIRNIDPDDVVSTLGLKWNRNTDEFQFEARIAPYAPTKRKMLSAISKLLDPLGLIGPVLTVAKIPIQGLWNRKLDWDDPLPEDILSQWEKFQDNLRQVNKICILLVVINTSEGNRFCMHGFCDASESAYGACIYIQSISRSGKINVRLLCSKARVAP